MFSFLGFLTCSHSKGKRSHSFLRKLVSYGGLDLNSDCLAPFEISVLGEDHPHDQQQRNDGQP